MKGVYQHCGEKHLHRYLANSISAIQTVRGLAAKMLSALKGWRLALSGSD